MRHGASGKQSVHRAPTRRRIGETGAREQAGNLSRMERKNNPSTGTGVGVWTWPKSVRNASVFRRLELRKVDFL